MSPWTLSFTVDKKRNWTKIGSEAQVTPDPQWPLKVQAICSAVAKPRPAPAVCFPPFQSYECRLHARTSKEFILDLLPFPCLVPHLPCFPENLFLQLCSFRRNVKMALMQFNVTSSIKMHRNNAWRNTRLDVQLHCNQSFRHCFYLMSVCKQITEFFCLKLLRSLQTMPYK